MKRHSGDGEKFNEEQMAWLRMIRDHIISSFHMDKTDLDMAPFDSKGGLGKMYQLFGNKNGQRDYRIEPGIGRINMKKSCYRLVKNPYPMVEVRPNFRI